MLEYKQQRNEARAFVLGQAAVIEDMRRELLGVRLRGRLLRVEDFWRFIGLEAVTDRFGGVDWDRVDAAVDELTRRRPELAASADDRV